MLSRESPLLAAVGEMVTLTGNLTRSVARSPPAKRRAPAGKKAFLLTSVLRFIL